MPICLDLCFHMPMYLDLCSLHAFCYISCACALHAIFVCLDLGYVCHVMCYCSPFIALSFFLVFWPIGSDSIWNLWSLSSSMPLGPHQMVWIILICMSMLACVSLSCSRLCHVWHPQRVCSCMVTSDAYEALSGCNHLGSIATMSVALCIPFPFSAPCDDMLTMLVCATRWLYMHLCTLAYISMHESCLLVCRPCFNTMKLWTFDLNLHFSLADTTFCSLSCLFDCFLACLPSRLFACFLVSLFAMSTMFICFMPLSYTLCIFSFHCLSTGFLSLPLHVHTWREDAWS